MSKFQKAGVAETLWSAQKDEYYLQYARNLCAESVQGTIGVPHWLKWREVYETASDFIYYLLTTLSGRQTLGEEYVHIVQVDSSLRRLPILSKRVLLVVLQVLGPLILRHLQRNMLNELQRCSQHEISATRRNNLQKCLNLVSAILWSMSIIQRLHFILFLFNGTFYHLSKRISGIRYVIIRRYLAHLSSQKLYNVLGCLAAVQLLIILLQDLQKVFKVHSSTEDGASQSNKEQELTHKNQCSLCLSMRQDSTVTPCGHLFCWSCITNWLRTKEACPLCREKFSPSRLVYLQNYQ